MTRRVLMQGASVLLLAQVVRAQSPAGGAKMALEHDAPDMTVKG